MLREHAHEVTQFDRGLRKLAKRMIRTMHDAPGVGLAAPQVGVLQRLLVYDVDDDPRVLVNPSSTSSRTRPRRPTRAASACPA